MPHLPCSKSARRIVSKAQKKKHETLEQNQHLQHQLLIYRSRLSHIFNMYDVIFNSNGVCVCMCSNYSFHLSGKLNKVLILFEFHFCSNSLQFFVSNLFHVPRLSSFPKLYFTFTLKIVLTPFVKIFSTDLELFRLIQVDFLMQRNVYLS